MVEGHWSIVAGVVESGALLGSSLEAAAWLSPVAVRDGGVRRARGSWAGHMGGHLHGWQAGPSARPEASRTCPREGLSVDSTLSSCVRSRPLAQSDGALLLYRLSFCQEVLGPVVNAVFPHPLFLSLALR